MAKEIFFNDEAKQLLQAGMNEVADAVGSTMGACGKTVIISNHYNLDPIATKDGVTVASCIILKDPLKNIGARLIRNASAATYKDAGDGTTQTAVLAQSLINNGLAAVREGKSPQQIKAGMDKAVDCVVATLKKISKPVNDNETIKNIATISANNDEKIGALIAEGYSKIGHEGLMLIEESGTIETKIEGVDGVEIPRGYISPEFVNDKAKQRVVYENPLILVADYTIARFEELRPILEELSGKGLLAKHPLVVIASDYEGEAFSSMLQNHKLGHLKTCLIKPPSTYRKEHLDDMSIVTGATLLCAENGFKVENATVEHLGTCDKIIITENSTTFVGGAGDKDKLQEQKDAVKAQRDDMKDEELKKVWDIRLARISGKMCVIKVGGSTDVEVKEKKDRVDDACRAVKSSIEEGIVIGGGVALLQCLFALEKFKFNDPSADGIGLVIKACQAPLLKMLANAGLDSDIAMDLLGKVKADSNLGYNVKTQQFENLFKSGVIDPTKVIRCAIQNAASVATYAITTDCLVVEMLA